MDNESEQMLLGLVTRRWERIGMTLSNTRKLGVAGRITLLILACLMIQWSCRGRVWS